MRCFRVAIVCLIVLLASVDSGNTADESNKIWAGQFHPNCAAAIAEMPLDEELLPTNEDGGKITVVNRNPKELRKHYLRYAAKYLAYDKACFFGWQCEKNCLSFETRDFLANNAGALFREEGLNEIVPYCSAFRIASDIIVTAAHCQELYPMQFRLFGDPKTPLKATVWLPGKKGSDLQDFMFLKIQEPNLPFTWKPENFTRGTIPRQSIVVVAISAAVYQIEDLRVDDWLKAVRFSRANASQLVPLKDVKPPLVGRELREECIFHRASTFEGMSGAPILALRLSSSNTPRRFIVGIHIRNGSWDSPCGYYPQYNVGIRVPKDLLRRGQSNG
jgi:hypothetical protein